MAEFEKGFEAFLQSEEYRQLTAALQEALRKAYAAGWIAAVEACAASDWTGQPPVSA